MIEGKLFCFYCDLTQPSRVAQVQPGEHQFQQPDQQVGGGGGEAGAGPLQRGACPTTLYYLYW